MNLCYTVPMRFLIIFSVLVLASCSKKEAEPVESTGVEAPDTQAPAEAEATAEAPSEAAAAAEQAVEAPPTDWGELGVATLLEPGKAPLGKLRRTFKKGDTAEVELQMTGGGEGDPPLGHRYLVTLTTRSVSSDGSKATVGLEVEEVIPVGTNANPAAAPSYSRVAGMRGSYVVDSFGVITDFDLVPPKEEDSTTTAAVRGLRFIYKQGIFSIPVPAEEVGVGARWSFVVLLGNNDSLLQQTTYEITKIKGSAIEVSLTSKLASPKPRLNSMVKWLGAWGTGKGAASFDLAGVVPVQANWDVEQNDKYFIPAKGAEVTTINIAYKLSSR